MKLISVGHRQGLLIQPIQFTNKRKTRKVKARAIEVRMMFYTYYLVVHLPKTK
jgi:hypothetical protein